MRPATSYIGCLIQWLEPLISLPAMGLSWKVFEVEIKGRFVFLASFGHSDHQTTVARVEKIYKPLNAQVTVQVLDAQLGIDHTEYLVFGNLIGHDEYGENGPRQRGTIM